MALENWRDKRKRDRERKEEQGGKYTAEHVFKNSKSTMLKQC
jgi:hypothetical protein